MRIIGAGLAGLLAANVLRKHNPIIYEAQSNLPENHSALLRHKTNKISEATAIPFKKVTVQKEIFYKNKSVHKPSISMMNEYSNKVIGEYQSRSITNLDPDTRFISPTDFVQKLALGCNIQFNNKIDDIKEFAMQRGNPKFFIGKDDSIISTMPIMVLAKQLGYSEIENFNFKYSPVIVATVDVHDCNLYQTIYYPELSEVPYRISITGNRAIMEIVCPSEDQKDQILKADLERYLNVCLSEHFGIYNATIKDTFKVNVMKYGKINKLENQDDLKALIGKITREWNIYSLGRFATWRNILLDDVIDDILFIQKLIESKGYYTGK